MKRRSLNYKCKYYFSCNTGADRWCRVTSCRHR